MRRFLILFLFIALRGFCHESDLLKTKDISHIMQQILSEHVNKNEMTVKILQNAFRVYIDQFDPHRMYLLESEVAPYFNTSSDELQKAIRQYKSNDFSPFEKLNDLIQASIERSRTFRKKMHLESLSFKLNGDLKKLIGNDEFFAATVEQLKFRIEERAEDYLNLQKRRYGDAMTPQRKEQLLASFELKLKEFENQYLYQNMEGEPFSPAEKESLFVLHVLKALANSLDSHTSFYKANEAFDLRIRLQKEFKGLGLVLKDASHGVIVTHLLEGGPAAKSRLIEIGDILIKVDDVSILDVPFEKVMELLHGDKNSHVLLTFKREGSGKEAGKIYTADLTRERITMNQGRVEVSSEPFGSGIIGIIALHSFYQGKGISSEEDVKNAIEKLEKQGNLKGLILDLRDNGGGFLSQAVKVAGLFITDGIIVISKYSNGDERIYRDVDGKVFYDGPLIILTSKATASAAEIVAQSLQDWGVALVVGDEHTYGKGTIQAQTVTDNQSSSYFKVTVGKYYTVSGKTPQKEGVKADIVVPSHWSHEKIGEMYADSVEADTIAPAFKDTLKDIAPNSQSLYLKYYIPKLQKKTAVWQESLPVLRKNSLQRIAENKNYQYFIEGAPSDDDDLLHEEEWIVTDKKNRKIGEDNLQEMEAINILKDMIMIRSLKRN